MRAPPQTNVAKCLDFMHGAHFAGEGAQGCVFRLPANALRREMAVKISDLKGSCMRRIERSINRAMDEQAFSGRLTNPAIIAPQNTWAALMSPAALMGPDNATMHFDDPERVRLLLVQEMPFAQDSKSLDDQYAEVSSFPCLQFK